jgi:hypothetical protein
VAIDPVAIFVRFLAQHRDHPVAVVGPHAVFVEARIENQRRQLPGKLLLARECGRVASQRSEPFDSAFPVLEDVLNDVLEDIAEQVA